MKIHNTVSPGNSTFRRVAEVVVGQVVDNYLFTSYDEAVKGQIYADVIEALNVLWKNTKFKMLPSFNSYSMVFDFTIFIDENDPIFFSTIYSWSHDDF